MHNFEQIKKTDHEKDLYVFFIFNRRKEMKSEEYGTRYRSV